MGRHLSWILLNKVLIRAHVAPFQTKLITHNSPGTPLPLPHRQCRQRWPHQPRMFSSNKTSMTYCIWQLVDPFTPRAEMNTHYAPDAGESQRVTHHTGFLTFEWLLIVSHEETGSTAYMNDQVSASMKHYWIHTEFSSGGADVNPDSQTET